VPLVLWREDSRRGRLVAATCAHGQSLGVKPGQPLHEATALLLQSKPLVIRHDPPADREKLDELASIFQQRLSPLVAIEPEPLFAGITYAQPQTLLLDVTGIGDWFGDETAMLNEASDVLREQNLIAKMAIADTSAAAWALAHFGREPTSCALPGCTLEAISSLPVRALRLDEQTAHQLDRLGLRRISDVLELPRNGLAARLGSDLLRRVDEILGHVDQTLSMHHAATEESAVCTLEYPTNARDIVEYRLRLLVENISQKLASRRRGALRLTCQIEMVQQPPQWMEIGLFVPTADSEHLSRLVTGAIEQHRFPAMVERLTLSVTLGGPLQQYQPTMFGDDSFSQVTTRRSLARMIETLAGRLGRSTVSGIELTRDPLPEAAFKHRPLAGETRSPLSLGKNSAHRTASKRKGVATSLKSPRQSALPKAVGPSAGDPMRRPLKLRSTPRPIEICEFNSDGLPKIIRVEQRTYEIVRHWGPERIETGWWDGPQIRRDYFRIELATGTWWWVYRQLSRQSVDTWQHHGDFD
jgi:protein ImuB